MADFEHYGAEPVFRRGGYRNTYVYGETAQRAYDATMQRAHDATMAPDADPDPQAAGLLGRVATWAGALISIGLVVAMGGWAWQLTVRDVSGVPVIRALDGPVRTVPSDPGGAQAPHQGLAVNRIAEGSEAAPVPDRIVLAPAPLDLDDMALDLAGPVAEPEAPSDTRALIDRALQAAAPAPGVTADLDAAAVADVAPDETPAAGDTEVAAADADITEVARAQSIPASVPGVSRSLRPLLRPASLETAPSSVLTSSSEGRDPARATAADGVTEVSIDDLPVGTRLVQLGAFDSPEIARSEWTRLSGLYPDYFAGRARIVQQATSGGQAFYRLRANGFEDLDASRRFCAAMVARGAACIPVTVR